jgi:hypothetical protein
MAVVPSSPAVMLSPNATKRVSEIGARASTVTVSVQLLVRCFASVAVHVTVVVPMGKVAPLSGVHVMFTGRVPPASVGVP